MVTQEDQHWEEIWWVESVELLHTFCMIIMTTVVLLALKAYDTDNNYNQSQDLIGWQAWFSPVKPKATGAERIKIYCNY